MPESRGGEVGRSGKEWREDKLWLGVYYMRNEYIFQNKINQSVKDTSTRNLVTVTRSN